MDCRRCGTCCVAPDIAALDKPLGFRCPHLGPDLLCAIYSRRPEICRAHRPDGICEQIVAPTLEERAARYLEIFGLTEEARRIAAAGTRSMAEARRVARSEDGNGNR